MATFAEFLARREDLPVIDMTGLKGFYYLTLVWVPEPKGDPPDPAAGPAIPMALQEQLGLRLESRKAPIEIVIVDHPEKLSAGN